MRPFLSTASGKMVFAGILVVLTGALAKAAGCPYDNAILIVGIILAVIGGIMQATSHSLTD
ncbi:hypothetical protein [Polluticoccus soli]|uniref:hypothetical protein n=1 Tax=Polluticoccus soli TaxID=3034150 RepID=UPI0023E18601|nr:hypothetical protein [Flavipsychrobacter sp. JY13-12]